MVLSKDSFENHMEKLEVVLEKLLQVGLRISVKQSIFCTDIIQYFGYFLTHEGLKPLPQKIQAILALQTLPNIMQLQTMLVPVQCYQDR